MKLGSGGGEWRTRFREAREGLRGLTCRVAGHELVSQELPGLHVVGSGQVHGNQDAGVWEGG